MIGTSSWKYGYSYFNNPAPLKVLCMYKKTSEWAFLYCQNKYLKLNRILWKPRDRETRNSKVDFPFLTKWTELDFNRKGADK